MNRLPTMDPDPPRPAKTRTAYLRGVTGIVRIWHREDLGRCRLCRECTLDIPSASCLILVGGDVPTEAAPLFSTRDLRRASR